MATYGLCSIDALALTITLVLFPSPDTGKCENWNFSRHITKCCLITLHDQILADTSLNADQVNRLTKNMDYKVSYMFTVHQQGRQHTNDIDNLNKPLNLKSNHLLQQRGLQGRHVGEVLWSISI